MRRKPSIPKADFTEKDLPKTRREQFFQIVKDNYPLLIKIGLVLLIFLVPFLIAIFVKYSLISSIQSNSGISDETKAQSLYLTHLIFNGIYVLCFIILFIPLGGVLKIYRRLIWNEPLFALSDFTKGIKENILSFLFIGFLVGVINFINIFIYYSFSTQYLFLSFISAGISLAIIVPILITACYLNSVYNSNIIKNIVVAARLFIRRGLFILLLLAPLYAFYFLSLIPVYIIIYILILMLLFVFLLPLIVLASYINSFKNADDYINQYHYPDKAYLGLYKPNNQKQQQEQK